ncbi:hypothetical protein C3488_07745 [Streptomyces sp. Ru72]|nr:hypothetical protein C3488_07745 [Streptomyces sp. Ru72]
MGPDLRGSRQSGCLKPWSRPPQPRRCSDLDWAVSPLPRPGLRPLVGADGRRRAAPVTKARRGGAPATGRRRRAVRGTSDL